MIYVIVQLLFNNSSSSSSSSSSNNNNNDKTSDDEEVKVTKDYDGININYECGFTLWYVISICKNT